MARAVGAVLREIDQIQKSVVLSPAVKEALIAECKREIEALVAQGNLRLEVPAGGAMAPRKG